jgi:CHAT domain-containing protein
MKSFFTILVILIPFLSSSQVTIDTAKGKKIYHSIKKLVQTNQIDSAESLIPGYLKIYRSHLISHEDSIQWGYSSGRIADLFRRNGFTKKALPYYEQAYPTAKIIYGEGAVNVGRICYNLGINYTTKGRTEDAIEFFEKTARIFEKELGEEHRYVGITYNALGNSYGDLYQNEKALAYYLKALSIYKKLKKTSNIGRTYTNIGALYKRKKNYKNAIHYFNEAVNVFNEFDKKGSNFDNYENEKSKTYSYLNIGQTYAIQERYDSAHHYYRLAQAFHENDNNYQPYLPDLADVYNSLARLFSMQNNVDSAQYYGEKSLNIYHKEFGKKHPKLVDGYITLGQAYEINHDLATATIFYQHALASSMSSFSNIKDIFKNPIPSSDSEFGSSFLLVALTNKANVFLERYKVNKDKKWLEGCLDICKTTIAFTNQMRASLSHEDQIVIGDEVFDIFEIGSKAAALLYSLTSSETHKEQVLFFSEKKKATTLSNILVQLEAKNLSGIPAALIKKERILASELTFYNTEIQKKIAENDKDTVATMAIYDSLFVYNQQYGELIDLFEKDYPEYYQLKHNQKVISSSQIQSNLDEGTAIVSYSLNDDQIIINTLTNSTFDITIKKVDTERLNLNKAIYNLHKLLQKKTLIQNHNKEKFIQNSFVLYQHLIEPIEALIKGQKRLIFIPEGMLHYVPFETLIASDKERSFQKMPYLIKDFEISYHHSVTLYSDFAQKDTYSNASSMLAVAPIFDDNVEPAFMVSRQYGALLWSEKEVDFIQDLYQTRGKEITVLKRELANEYDFKRLLSQASFQNIHLSSHGLANASNPNLSWIAFLENNLGNDSEDGLLYTSEVYNLELKTNLLVLSSCESGLGQLAKGEGMISTNRGFLYAGALNIVYSIWKVNDKYTYELMTGFYKSIFEGMSYSKALRQSKLDMINKSRIAAIPTNWSGFLLLGQ